MENSGKLSVSGNIVDVVKKRIFQGTINIENAKIISVIEEETNATDYILPGLIDSHVHIESSMLIPSEFARLAVCHGTVATVSDPHEIANVKGIEGVKFMIDNARKTPFKFYFGASSCVPATPFETAGDVLDTKEIEELLKMDDIKYLAEMMNFPGVIFKDEKVYEKLNLAKKYNKPIDGHAPGLNAEDIKKYVDAGISTDHECFTIEEAIEKIKTGMKIQIREGSAAKNFDTLIDLIKDYPDMIMFCSDDKHPDELVKGHINLLIKRAINKGYDPIDVVRIASYNPSKHYNLDSGLLQTGDSADFIIVNNLKDFDVKSTFINGIQYSENGKTFLERVKEKPFNTFNADKIKSADISVEAKSDKIKVIEALDGQLITNFIIEKAKIVNNKIVSDTENDILKIIVLNRYNKSKPSVAFIKNFGLKKGAIASTVAHDSHNIIALGTNDSDITDAINALITSTGGIIVANNKEIQILPLAVAGLMSIDDGFEVAKKYESIDKKVKELGSRLSAPFMTLSFMALLVIPEIKISDKGLFDGTKFEFTDVYVK